MYLFDSSIFPAEASWPSGAASAQAIEAGVEVINELSMAIEKLNKYNSIDIIVMDCIGYNQDMKSKVSMGTGKPVVLARTMIARVLGEMLNQ